MANWQQTGFTIRVQQHVRMSCICRAWDPGCLCPQIALRMEGLQQEPSLAQTLALQTASSEPLFPWAAPTTQGPNASWGSLARMPPPPCRQMQSLANTTLPDPLQPGLPGCATDRGQGCWALCWRQFPSAFLALKACGAHRGWVERAQSCPQLVRPGCTHCPSPLQRVGYGGVCSQDMGLDPHWMVRSSQRGLRCGSGTDQPRGGWDPPAPHSRTEPSPELMLRDSRVA